MVDAGRAGGDVWLAAVRVSRAAPVRVVADPFGEFAREWCLVANEGGVVADLVRLGVSDVRVNWFALGVAVRLFFERRGGGLDGCMGLCVTVAAGVVDAGVGIPTHSLVVDRVKVVE
jgi:hypothetical protein